ncbi:MAG: hypothetical protein K1Y36_16775 [Blastocatellia bacterium]|nr:hypothetical protein [Blastocatellia bacterium]
MPKLNQDPEEGTVIRYLLGQLSAAEQERVELRFFRDDEFAEQVCALETELIDRYVTDSLTALERQSFEKKFLTSPSRKERVEIAKTLIQEAPQSFPVPLEQNTPTTVASWKKWFQWIQLPRFEFQPAWAAACLFLVAVGTWLGWNALQLRQDLSVAQNEKEQLHQQNRKLETNLASEKQTNEQLAQSLKQAEEARNRLEQQGAVPPTPTPPVTLLSFLIAPGLVRDSASSNPLVLPPKVGSVQLLLLLTQEDTYPSYQVVIKNNQQKAVWKAGGLHSRKVKNGRAVAVVVPTPRLAAGSYSLTLAGATANGTAEELEDYVLEVQRH